MIDFTLEIIYNYYFKSSCCENSTALWHSFANWQQKMSENSTKAFMDHTLELYDELKHTNLHLYIENWMKKIEKEESGRSGMEECKELITILIFCAKEKLGLKMEEKEEIFEIKTPLLKEELQKLKLYMTSNTNT